MILIVETLPRLFRTLRYVPPRLLGLRLQSRLKTLYYRSPFFGLSTLKEAQSPAITYAGPELLHGDRERGKAMATGQFHLAGIPLTLRLPEETHGMTWFPPRVSALGVFELHYHTWLADLKAAGERTTAQRLVADWLMQFGSFHPTAWHPYPTSLRIVSWLTYGAWLLEDAPEDLAETLASSLARQLDYLAANCETSHGGNHLIKNLKALMYGGLCVEGRHPLFTSALAELLRQLKVQILPDGGHNERTPLYHAQVLRDVLELRALMRKLTGASNAALEDAVHRMGTVLGAYLLGDGKMALFNDSAEGDADTLRELLRLSGADDAPALLPQSGYARVVRGPLTLIFDAGKVGPDENPGHAHADTLSFELSHKRQRVIVNQGTFAYQHPLRQVLRGTPAHSTVDVEGQNSAEVWKVFRVGRRPRHVALDLKSPEGADALLLGAHDGYTYLGVRHARKLLVAADGSRLRGEDELVYAPGLLTRILGTLGKKRPPSRVTAHFHLHPAVEARLISEKEAHLTLPDGTQLRMTATQGRLDMKDGRYAPQFGVMMTSRQIVLQGRMARGLCKLEWGLEVTSL